MDILLIGAWIVVGIAALVCVWIVLAGLFYGCDKDWKEFGGVLGIIAVGLLIFASFVYLADRGFQLPHKSKVTAEEVR
jgi:hypothetical protein